MLTSNHVCGETWTFLKHRAGHAVAVAFLDRVESSERFEIAFVGRELEREAFTWLRRHDERDYSFVDATSFALMRARGDPRSAGVRRRLFGRRLRRAPRLTRQFLDNG